MSQTLADFLEVFNDTNKTVIMAALLGISIFFRTKGYITPDGFVDLIKTTVVSYYGTTTVIHFTSMIKDSLAAKLKGTPTPPSIEEG